MTDFQKAACAYDSRPTDSVSFLQNVQYDKCAPYNYSSTPVLKRCVPNAPINASFYANTSSAAATSIEVQGLVNSGRDQVDEIVIIGIRNSC